MQAIYLYSDNFFILSLTFWPSTLLGYMVWNTCMIVCIIGERWRVIHNYTYIIWIDPLFGIDLFLCFVCFPISQWLCWLFLSPGAFIWYLLEGLTYPDEAVKSLVVYMFVQLISATDSSLPYNVISEICNHLPSILADSRTNDLTVNLMGIWHHYLCTCSHVHVHVDCVGYYLGQA